MKSLFGYLCLICMMVLMVGCSEISGYDDNDVAATVRGNEITVGDLRFLYPDDTALDYLEGAISVELVKQEVKDMSLDISDNLSDNDVWFMELPPKNTKDEDGKQIRKFAESQAKKLDMEPEEYQREYAKKIDEQNAYMVTYLEEKLGAEAFDGEKGMDSINEKADYLLVELAEEYEDEIEVLIE
ncbi:hypothetical protein OPHB3_3752 [Oceanobacillus picturae]|uniref:Uncharacterized protein n=1 Tax=Oceanobacillus picturae TaxID=171693 RepID=A0A0U9HHP9_9BACI|nr:hypothetical protein [Oceanobacillus picturae]GAQ19768.1 hypothetical protein OPHB3_3752 [Oceanobacillus picturae]